MNSDEDSSTKTLGELVSHSERLGAIGSPSRTNQLTIDIFGSSTRKKLLGELGIFAYSQNNLDHYALGQITEIILQNRMLEQSIGRGIVRERERWDAVQDRQDTHTATMNLGAVFSVADGIIEPSILGTVPPTGTAISLVNDEILTTILRPCQDLLFYLGQVYGSDVLLPMWFKHFDAGRSGLRESYNIGVFGRTGSGKSVLAKMMVIAYALHDDMGIFILDPQGEFSKGLANTSIDDEIDMGEILNSRVLDAIGRHYRLYSVTNLVLDSWDIFQEALNQTGFFDELGIGWPEYKERIAQHMREALDSNKNIRLSTLGEEKSLAFALDAIAGSVEAVYKTRKTGQENRENIERIRDDLESPQGKIVKKKWMQVAGLFAKRKNAESIDGILRKALEREEGQARNLVVIDLSESLGDIPTNTWESYFKPLLIHRFLTGLLRQASLAYKGNRSLNTLVVIDEAHNLVPREDPKEERRSKIRSTLVNSVRTTRKYGLGWMFISQNISSLEKQIIYQLRSSFFGYGLGFGAELQSLREIVGGDKEYLRLYQSFRDPHSAFSSEHKRYSFMAMGPVSPLAFEGAPLFFDAFTDPEVFLKTNNIVLGNEDGAGSLGDTAGSDNSDNIGRCIDCGREIESDPKKPRCLECWKKEMGYE